MKQIRFYHLLVPDAETRLPREFTEDYDGESSKWELILETSFPPGKVGDISYKNSGHFINLKKGMRLAIHSDFRIEVQDWKFCRIGKILFFVIFILFLVIVLSLLYYAAKKSMHPVSIYNFRIGTVIK